MFHIINYLQKLKTRLFLDETKKKVCLSLFFEFNLKLFLKHAYHLLFAQFWICRESTFMAKCFPFVFKFIRFEERFRKVPSSWRISVQGWPNRRKKAGAFLSYSLARTEVTNSPRKPHHQFSSRAWSPVYLETAAKLCASNHG